VGSSRSRSWPRTSRLRPAESRPRTSRRSMADRAACTEVHASTAARVGSGPARSATATAVRSRSRCTAHDASFSRMMAALIRLQLRGVDAVGVEVGLALLEHAGELAHQVLHRTGQTPVAQQGEHAGRAPQEPIGAFDARGQGVEHLHQIRTRCRLQLAWRPVEQGQQLAGGGRDAVATTTQDGDDAAHGDPRGRVTTGRPTGPDHGTGPMDPHTERTDRPGGRPDRRSGPGDRSGAVERLGDVGEDLLERDADGLDAGPQPLHVPHVGERLDLGAHRIELGLQPLALGLGQLARGHPECVVVGSNRVHGVGRGPKVGRRQRVRDRAHRGPQVVSGLAHLLRRVLGVRIRRTGRGRAGEQERTRQRGDQPPTGPHRASTDGRRDRGGVGGVQVGGHGPSRVASVPPGWQVGPERAHPPTARSAGGAHNSGQRLGHGTSLVVGGRLDHHPHQWLGAAGPQQHPTVLAQVGFGGPHVGRHLVQQVGIPPVGAHVHQHLGQPGHGGGRQVPQRTAGALHHVEQAETGEDAVSGGGQVAEDDVTRLLPAQGEPAAVQFLQHVAVSHGRVDHPDAAGCHALAEPQVAHDRHHHGVVGEQAALVAVHRADADDLVAVHQGAVGVDRQDPVGVAVEGQTHIGTRRHHRRLEVGGVGGAAPFVDVHPVGAVVDGRDGGTQIGEHGYRQGRRRAVGGVDDHPQAGQVTAVEHVDGEPVAVAGHRLRIGDQGADRGTGRPQVGVATRAQHGELGLQRRLDLVGELAAAGGEQLDAVVAEGVVRGRDHGRRAIRRAPPAWATPGVGSTPRSTTSAPSDARPAASAAASSPPDRRVSRPMYQRAPPSTRAADRPSRRANSGVSSTLATPRTPSVPNFNDMAEHLPGSGRAAGVPAAP
jgi:hypothetical protein